MTVRGVFGSIMNKARFHRKGVIVGVIVAAILIIVSGYGVWSKSVWDSYGVNYNSWHDTVQRDIADTLALPAANDQDRNKKLIALKNISTSVESSKDTLCVVNNLVGWQKLSGTLSARQDACRQKVDSLAAFNSKLKPVIVYYEDEQALARVFAKATNSPAELAEDAWEAQATMWLGVSKEAEALPSHADFAATKQKASQATKVIAAAWQEILAAHKAKDKGRYLAAQAKLALGYEGIKEVAVTSGQHLQPLLGKLPMYQ